MTSSTRLLTRAFLSSLPLIAACSTGKPPGDDELMGASATGGATSGTSGNGGSSATSMGGSGATAANGGSVGAMGGASGSAATGGAAATAATGGDGAMGGTSGSAASGGDAGSAAAGGTAGASAAAGMSGTAGTDPGICQELSVVPTRQVPTVEILVDDSSSMYEPDSLHPNPWEMLYAALMDPATGAIKPLADQVRFGFASFRSPKGISVPEDDDACAQIVTVPIALSNYDAIDTVYQSVGKDARMPQGCGDTPNTANCGQTQWDTPTGHSIAKVATDLAAYSADPPGKKYILFVTDGTPNTCLVGDPNCGQDIAIAAVQNAFTSGIGTFVIGVGDIINEMCDAQAGRCGANHLQDIANAGVGQPVAPPPDSFWYQQCATKQSGTNPGTPVATYAASDAAAGTATFYTATDAAELKTALAGLLNDVISCTVDMNAIVTGDPALGNVAVGGVPQTYADPNGWMLEANAYSVTLQGTACDAFKAGSTLNISFPCDPSGNPIAVHR
jgi:hypothetical protein